MNKYTEKIIAGLEQQRNEVERNYSSFLFEFENQRMIMKELSGDGESLSREYQEAGLSSSACFRKLNELHEESMALLEAIRAIHNA